MGKIPKPFEKPKKSSNKVLSTNIKPLKIQKGNKNGPEKLVGKLKKKELFMAISKNLEENGDLPKSLKKKKSRSKKDEVLTENPLENEHSPGSLKRKVRSNNAGDKIVNNELEVALENGFKKKSKSKPKEDIKIQQIDDLFAGHVLKKYNIKLEDIKSAIDGVIQFHKENPKLKNQLFDGSFPLSLTVNCHKIPRGHSKLFRVPLKNSLLTPDDDVCLITSEVKGIGNKEHEKHIEHYENLFATKGVTNIKKIMTFHEFRTEYETFEQKCRLVDLYDAFLVCGKISGKVVKKCGKLFYKRRKVPIPVKLQATKLKTQIDQALSKTFFNVHLKGDSYNLQFGHSLMDKTQIIENFLLVLEFLGNKFPGGFENIKGLHVYAPRSTSIPVFMSTKSANELGKITTNTSKQQPIKTCRGELTTLPNAEVIVKPSGQVFVKRIWTESDEPSDEKITDEDIIQANKEDDNKEIVANKKRGNAADVSENKVKKGHTELDVIQGKEDDKNGETMTKKTRKRRKKENSSVASDGKVTKFPGKKAKITEEIIENLTKETEENITKKNKKHKVVLNTTSNSKVVEKRKHSKSVNEDVGVVEKQKANRNKNGIIKDSNSKENKKNTTSNSKAVEKRKHSKSVNESVGVVAKQKANRNKNGISKASNSKDDKKKKKKKSMLV